MIKITQKSKPMWKTPCQNSSVITKVTDIYVKIVKFEIKVCLLYGKWEMRDITPMLLGCLVQPQRVVVSQSLFQLLPETYPYAWWTKLTFSASPTQQEWKHWVMATDSCRQGSHWVRELIFSILIILFGYFNSIPYSISIFNCWIFFF